MPDERHMALPADLIRPPLRDPDATPTAGEVAARRLAPPPPLAPEERLAIGAIRAALAENAAMIPALLAGDGESYEALLGAASLPYVAMVAAVPGAATDDTLLRAMLDREVAELALTEGGTVARGAFPHLGE